MMLCCAFNWRTKIHVFLVVGKRSVGLREKCGLPDYTLRGVDGYVWNRKKRLTGICNIRRKPLKMKMVVLS
jgi:hypothetical protein